MKSVSPFLASASPDGASADKSADNKPARAWDERTLRYDEFAALQRAGTPPSFAVTGSAPPRERTVPADEFAALMHAGVPAVETRSVPQTLALELPPTPPEFEHLYAALERQAASLSGRPAGSVGLTPPFALGVTSAVAGEGKTTVALHLALTAARNTYKRVCLLDMSLSADGLGTLLGLPMGTGEGVVSILEDAGTVVPTLQIAGCDNLVIIPAGKAAEHPARLARAPRAAQLLASARHAFDLVIVDLPAVSSDNVLPLCQPLDGILLVVRAGATPQPVVADALEMLGRERVLGVTLNRIAPEAAKRRPA